MRATYSPSPSHKRDGKSRKTSHRVKGNRHQPHAVRRNHWTMRKAKNSTESGPVDVFEPGKDLPQE